MDSDNGDRSVIVDGDMEVGANEEVEVMDAAYAEDDHEWLLFVDTAVEIIYDIKMLLSGVGPDRLSVVVQLIKEVSEACKYNVFYGIFIS